MADFQALQAKLAAAAEKLMADHEAFTARFPEFFPPAPPKPVLLPWQVPATPRVVPALAPPKRPPVALMPAPPPPPVEVAPPPAPPKPVPPDPKPILPVATVARPAPPPTLVAPVPEDLAAVTAPSAPEPLRAPPPAVPVPVAAPVAVDHGRQIVETWDRGMERLSGLRLWVVFIANAVPWGMLWGRVSTVPPLLLVACGVALGAATLYHPVLAARDAPVFWPAAGGVAALLLAVVLIALLGGR